MTVTDDLCRLEQMRDRGSLSEAEFVAAKLRVVGSGECGERAIRAINGFRRSAEDRWLGGVCGGLGEATGLASWAWRLGMSLAVFCGGLGLLVYLLLWICVPARESGLAGAGAPRGTP